MTKLDNKVALISGAGSGIGRATAQLFAKEQAVVGCLDKVASVDTATAICDAGGRAIGIDVDVADFEAVKSACADIQDSFGPIDILINNAGIACEGDIAVTSEIEWRQVFETNITGAFLMSKAVWPTFINQQSGIIVNNASVMALFGDLASVAYCSTKAALIGFTKALAADGAASGIRVNCVCPGFVDTPTLAKFADPDSGYRRFEQHIPMQRMATPTEIAKVFLFLCSEDSSYLTGSSIVVDGGASLGYCGSDLSRYLND